VNFADDPLPSQPHGVDEASPAEPPPGNFIGDVGTAPVFDRAPEHTKFVPQDLRVPWGWVDLLLFVLIAVAATIGLGIVVFAGFAAFHVRPALLRTSPRLGGLVNVIGDVLLFGALIGFLALQVRLRFRAPFWRTIGWRPLITEHPPRAVAGFVAGGFLLAFFVQFGAALFGTKSKLPIEDLFQDRVVVVLVLLLSVLMAPVVEETIFRGYIYPVIARSFGRGVGVVATGLLFGLLHAPQLWTGWAQIGLLIIVGIVLSYARAAKGTVVASYLVHLSYNFAVSLMFLLGSHWLRVLPTGP
jgi:membrane protease YdiL (CAAX protease family)